MHNEFEPACRRMEWLDPFYKQVWQKAFDDAIPISGTFELTPRCNFNCKMCYVHLLEKDIPKYGKELSAKKWIDIAKQAKEIAISKLNDVVILDTAGRLQIDETLMQELKEIKSNIKPHEILLVVDAMTGQEAVNIAQKFNEDLGIDGVILTKLDGDMRGGAAISVKKVTGKPIKFAGTGEKLNEIEEFDIFGGMSQDATKVSKIANKNHREIAKDKFNILVWDAR